MHLVAYSVFQLTANVLQVFVSLSWMAKATVQAALGPVCLKRLAENPNATPEEVKYGEIVLMICVLSIVLTAPIGAILISVSGTKLLTKTKPLHVVEGKLLFSGIVLRHKRLTRNIFRLATQSSSVIVRH